MTGSSGDPNVNARQSKRESTPSLSRSLSLLFSIYYYPLFFFRFCSDCRWQKYELDYYLFFMGTVASTRCLSCPFPSTFLPSVCPAPFCLDGGGFMFLQETQHLFLLTCISPQPCFPAPAFTSGHGQSTRVVYVPPTVCYV